MFGGDVSAFVIVGVDSHDFSAEVGEDNGDAGEAGVETGFEERVVGDGENLDDAINTRVDLAAGTNSLFHGVEHDVEAVYDGFGEYTVHDH